MTGFDELVERRIGAARVRGELDRLPGAGRPLVLDDDRDVPVALRMAHRVLKNAGFAPRAVQMRAEMAALEDAAAEAGGADRAALARLRFLRIELDAARGDDVSLALEEQRYRTRLAAALTRRG